MLYLFVESQAERNGVRSPNAIWLYRFLAGSNRSNLIFLATIPYSKREQRNNSYYKKRQKQREEHEGYFLLSQNDLWTSAFCDAIKAAILFLLSWE